MENSKKPFVIGLVGNLGAGKSLVRRMLERLGGLGIDADIITHRILLKASPVHQKVVEIFGMEILNEGGEIDRKKLAALVFSDPDRLKLLEDLVHPAVETFCRNLIADSPAPFVVIEAIKLLESKLADQCDSIWAVNVPLEVQVARVMLARGMTREQVLQRIQHQSHPEMKNQAAQVSIDNSASPDSTWKQVTAALTGLQNTNETLARSMSSFEQWINQHRSIRFLQPTNSILTRKLINAAQPIDWVNNWISSTIHNYVERTEMVSRASYFEMLVNLQGILHQPERRPELLSFLKIDNFILQPLYLFKLNQLKPFNLLLWLQSLQEIADLFSCEAILLPIPRKAESIKPHLLKNGYQPLAADNGIYGIWKSEVNRTRLSGYNVFAKILRSHFQIA